MEFTQYVVYTKSKEGVSEYKKIWALFVEFHPTGALIFYHTHKNVAKPEFTMYSPNSWDTVETANSEDYTGYEPPNS